MAHGALPSRAAGLLTPASAMVAPMGLAHRRRDVLRTASCLHRAAGLACVASMGRTGMPTGGAGGGLRDACRADSDRPSPLEHLGGGMRPPDHAGARVACALGGRPHVVPHPGVMRVGIWTLQGIGKRGRPAASGQITGVPLFDVLTMRLCRGGDVLRQPGDAVLLALTIPHNDLMLGTSQVCDAETQPRSQTPPGTGAEGAHEPGDTRERAQDLGNLVLGADHGETLRLLGPHHVVQPADVVLAYRLIQPQDGAEGLALRGGSHVPCDGSRRQAVLDFLQAHIARMTLAVQQHEAFDPPQRGVFGA